ncbi:FISUMP domain-containing protein [Fibrobacter sp. UBA4297]|uniref:FISUMP domain-containing protein n=1 Tax=Fibrobacter sp. UBA4297 TaxID=1946536 RepID=UPI0025BA22A0|nr:FISUMP domain-containing protein [Fibrobacter sp. UBA4297]
MRNTYFFLFAGFFAFLFTACSDSNPTDFYTESSSRETLVSSSTIISISSSNEIFSSSLQTNSSSSFSSSSITLISYGELIDERDGQVYKTIKIGEQTWMAENLNFDYHNRMASVLAQTLPSLCYNNSRDSCAKYGRLYSWSTAMDSAAVYGQTGIGCGIWRDGLQGTCKNDAYNYTRGACPENWHIPNESDINNFIKFANESPKNIEWLNHYWLYGENENIKYELLSQYGFFWSSIESDSSKAKALGVIEKKFNQFDAQKQSFYFIRCVKDEKPLIVSDYGTMTDERDDQVYKTVKIGTQWWMAENLNYAYIDSIETDYNRYDSASVCYNNAPDSCAKYGRLYMWDAAMDCKKQRLLYLSYRRLQVPWYLP